MALVVLVTAAAEENGSGRHWGSEHGCGRTAGSRNGYTGSFRARRGEENEKCLFG